ncbi:MAG: glycosyltransferase family 4 protein [Pirellulales bacterium]|nr:glycosyltransferase family 4 protein [Pirellulales bacterium]
MSVPTFYDPVGLAVDEVPVVLPLPQAVREDMQSPPGAAASRSGPFTCPCHALHLINGEHYAGAERVQDLLAKQLPQFGCEVGLVSLKPGRFATAREARSSPLHEMSMRGRLDLRVVKQIVALCRTERYDLIHAHTPRSALVGKIAARWTGVPLIYHVHSPAGRDSTRWLLNGVNAWTEWAAVRRADRLIAVSPSLREYMIGRGIESNRIVCIPNGVPSMVIDRKRRLPTHTWTLGVVALFRPRKGLEVLVDALALVRSQGHDVRLRAVGAFESPEYQTQIRGQVVRLGLEAAIDWEGFTRNISRELAKIDALVLPSLFGEGLPMVVLEAMAAGLPVIASRVEGVPEAVVHRETGYLVEPGSVSQLAAALDELIAQSADYIPMGQAARARHAAYFSDATMAQRVANLYQEVLTRKKANEPAPQI